MGGGFINGTAETVYKDGLLNCQAPLGYSLSLAIGMYMNIYTIILICLQTEEFYFRFTLILKRVTPPFDDILKFNLY